MDERYYGCTSEFLLVLLLVETNSSIQFTRRGQAGEEKAKRHREGVVTSLADLRSSAQSIKYIYAFICDYSNIIFPGAYFTGLVVEHRVAARDRKSPASSLMYIARMVSPISYCAVPNVYRKESSREVTVIIETGYETFSICVSYF